MIITMLFVIEKDGNSLKSVVGLNNSGICRHSGPSEEEEGVPCPIFQDTLLRVGSRVHLADLV